MTDLIVAMENFVPLNQQQRESKQVIADEIEQQQLQIDQLCSQLEQGDLRIAELEQQHEWAMYLLVYTGSQACLDRIAELEQQHEYTGSQACLDRIAELEGALRDARTGASFFASVVKSGEPWSMECNETLRKALGGRDD